MTAGDRAAVAAAGADDPVRWVTEDVFERDLAAGRYRPAWTWLALDGGRVVARAVWWGRGAAPLALDCLWADPAAGAPALLGERVLVAGLASLRAAGVSRPPACELRLPPDWRERPDVVSGVEWRRDACATAGLTRELERLQWRWEGAGAELPEPPRRLRFEPGDDAAFLDVFRRVAVGSLDVTTRRAVEDLGVEAAVAEQLQFYRSAPGERTWWRLALDGEGRVVGFVIPSATESGPNVGYLGIVPEARGRGLVDDGLAFVTRFQAQRGAERISATTDATNEPMAAAFARAGYAVVERRLVLSAPLA
jgi:RimJ/RimL family protein N-acetyltransferase